MSEFPIWDSITKKAKDPESEILEIMKMVKVFDQIPQRSLKYVRQMCHIRHYSADQHIFREDEPGVGMYIILNGKIEIYRDEKGQRRQYQILSEGDSFGELGLLEDTNRSASAIAMNDTRVLGFFRPDLDSMMQRKPRLAGKILFNLARVIGQKLIRTNQVLEEISLEKEEKEEKGEKGENHPVGKENMIQAETPADERDGRK